MSLSLFLGLRRQTALWVLLGVCLIAFFWRLGAAPLFDLDEALYVTCARQMIESGDYLTPRLNSHPPEALTSSAVAFFEKPIMVYWLAAGSMRLFGVSELAARLPVAFAALAAVLLVFFVGRKWFGERAGFLAALLYALAPMTMVDARQMTTDGLLVLWFFLAMLAFAKLQGIGEKSPLSGRAQWGYAGLFWGVCGVAILTKGAVGLLLPLLAGGVTLFLRGDSLRARVGAVWAGAKKMRPLLGLALCLLISAPWHLAMMRRTEQDAQGRTFVQEYLIRQHVGRFRGGDKTHNAPPPTYIAYFLAGFFPWASFAPVAFRRRKPNQAEPSDEESAAHSFLLAWFWTVFVFFTISAAKLPTYITPAYPAAALLLGRWLDGALGGGADRALRWGGFVALLVTGLLAIAGAMAPRFAPAHNPVPEAIIALARHVTLLLAAGSLAGWLCFLQKGRAWRRAGVACFSVTLLGFLLFASTEGYALIENEVAGRYQRMSRRANDLAAQGVPVIYYHIIPRRPSMLYYAKYSAYERKETPLTPLLLPLLYQNPARGVAVILSEQDLRERLPAELAASPDLQTEVLAQEGLGKQGWALVRVRSRRAR